jgi:hypothetical protein
MTKKSRKYFFPRFVSQVQKSMISGNNRRFLTFLSGKIEKNDEKIRRPPATEEACTEVWLLLQGGDLELATTEGLHLFRSVSLPYRPPYCREVCVNRYYTVKSATSPTECEVASVAAIIRVKEQPFWVVLKLMIPAPSGIDEQTGVACLWSNELRGLKYACWRMCWSPATLCTGATHDVPRRELGLMTMDTYRLNITLHWTTLHYIT